MREEITIRADELPSGVSANYLRLVAKTLGWNGDGVQILHPGWDGTR